MKKLPEKLHRYYNFKYGKEMLDSGKLYLSFVHEFNDIFELLPAMNHFDYTSLSDEELKDEFIQITESSDGKNVFENFGLSEIAASTTMALVDSSMISPGVALFTLAGVAIYKLFRSDKKEESDRLQLFIKECLPLKNSLKGCCFSTSDHDILMWSHYADSHQGLVVSYDMTKAFWKDMQIREMSYNDNRIPLPKKDYNAREYIWELLTRKAECWKYEQEWRLFNFNMKNKRRIPIDPKCVKAVKLGSRMREENREIIRDICRREYPHAVLMVEKASCTRYEISFEK